MGSESGLCSQPALVVRPAADPGAPEDHVVARSDRVDADQGADGLHATARRHGEEHAGPVGDEQVGS